MKDVIAFDIISDWGHFRKVETNNIRRSYKIPPTTTLSGLIAGVLGRDRDSYYSDFSRNNIRYSISILDDLRSINIPIKLLKTDGNSCKNLNSRGKPSLSMTDTRSNRLIINHEYIVDPRYRVYMDIEDENLKSDIINVLKNEEYYYSPSLGLSELLCDLEYVGEYEVEDSNENKVDSVVPIDNISIIPESNKSYSTEKHPRDMESEGNFRETVDFVKIAYSDNSKDSIKVDDNERVKFINGDNVIFY